MCAQNPDVCSSRHLGTLYRCGEGCATVLLARSKVRGLSFSFHFLISSTSRRAASLLLFDDYIGMLVKMGHFTEAMAAAEAATRLHPQSPDAWALFATWRIKDLGMWHWCFCCLRAHHSLRTASHSTAEGPARQVVQDIFKRALAAVPRDAAGPVYVKYAEALRAFNAPPAAVEAVLLVCAGFTSQWNTVP